MTIETLVATICQTDHSLATSMNLQTDALIGNQCGRIGTETIDLQGHRITFFHTDQRGVGQNRNLLLDQASAEILIFADDDMRFVSGYPAIARQAFAQCPKADVIAFNLIETQPTRYRNKTIHRLRWYNYGRYGAARLAARRSSLRRAGIRFREDFGGGTLHGSGEDTIFLHTCLKKGLRLYAVPLALAQIDQQAASTWFSGYDRKFFFDKGALYACLHPLIWPVFAVRFLLRYRKKHGDAVPQSEAWRAMLAGGRSFSRGEEGT